MPHTAMPDPTNPNTQARQAPPATGIKRHIPNALVILRLALAAIVFALLANWNPIQGPAMLYTAAILFIIAAITDGLDGFLARRWNAISLFGRVMDPLADKVLVLGTLIFLTGIPVVGLHAFQIDVRSINGGSGEIAGMNMLVATGFSAWMVAVIITRELLSTSLRAVAESSGRDFSASAVGKVKMVVQSVAIPTTLILAGFALRNRDLSWTTTIANLLIWTTTIVTIWSTIPYLFNAWDAFTGGRHHPKPKDALERATHSAARALTVHGFGLLKPFPGTWGSLPPVFLAGLILAAGFGFTDTSLGMQLPYYLPLAGVFLWSCWACITKGHLGEAIFNKKDPGAVVADEVAGMCIALIALPVTADSSAIEIIAWLVGAFLAFRFFDIIKPSPAREMQHIRGGWGILLDDLVAGVYALLTIQIIAAII